jgi:hypothetical protein
MHPDRVELHRFGFHGGMEEIPYRVGFAADAGDVVDGDADDQRVAKLHRIDLTRPLAHPLRA